MPGPIKVVIVDDHALMRQGLKKILEMESDIHVVGVAENGESGLKMVMDLKPDVVLMDINMPVMNGIQALRRIRDIGLDVRVIMLTIHEDREYLMETVNIGAEGYVLKDAETESLLRSIRNVYAGIPALSEEMDRVSREISVLDLESGKDALTRREYEVIALIAEGLNNKEIAEKLFISEKTVKNHVSSIFRKIHVTDRTQAAIFAFKHNIKKI